MYTYLPPQFKNEDPESIRNLVLQNSFATLTSVNSSGELFISHLPVILEQYGENWRFSFHLAKNNQHSPVLEKGAKSQLIFKGPHAYVSPSWYQKSPAVPTWNYAIAHFEGIAKPLDDEKLLSHLRQQIDLYEPELNGSDIMPDEFVDKLAGMICGFELCAQQQLCKFKLGQNRSQQDFDAIKNTLKSSDGMHGQALVKLMLSMRS